MNDRRKAKDRRERLLTAQVRDLLRLSKREKTERRQRERRESRARDFESGGRGVNGIRFYRGTGGWRVIERKDGAFDIQGPDFVLAAHGGKFSVQSEMLDRDAVVVTVIRYFSIRRRGIPTRVRIQILAVVQGVPSA